MGGGALRIVGFIERAVNSISSLCRSGGRSVCMETTLLVFIPLLLLFLSGAIVVIIILMQCDYATWFKSARAMVDARPRSADDEEEEEEEGRLGIEMDESQVGDI